MAKESGLGDRFYFGGVDLSGDTQSMREVTGSVGTIDVTDITQSAYNRLHGLREGKIGWVSFFNAAVGRAHPTLSPLQLTDVVMTYGHGVTLGNPAASMVAKQSNYDGNRGTDGSFVFNVDGVSNGFGLSWGVQLTPGLRADVAPTSPATGVDLTAVSTSFGWTAHLHLTAFTGTSVTVQLQDSADNATFANLGAGGAFAAMSAIGAQRLQSPGATDTVRRYVRVITTGTFTVATFLVNFTRNDVAAVY